MSRTRVAIIVLVLVHQVMFLTFSIQSHRAFKASEVSDEKYKRFQYRADKFWAINDAILKALNNHDFSTYEILKPRMDITLKRMQEAL